MFPVSFAVTTGGGAGRQRRSSGRPARTAGHDRHGLVRGHRWRTTVTLELPLNHLYRPAEPTAVDAAAGSPWLLVLMHGIGSNEQDLFSLGPHVPPPFHVLSLRAPNSLGPGSFAWFTFGVR